MRQLAHVFFVCHRKEIFKDINMLLTKQTCRRGPSRTKHGALLSLGISCAHRGGAFTRWPITLINEINKKCQLISPIKRTETIVATHIRTQSSNTIIASLWLMLGCQRRREYLWRCCHSCPIFLSYPYIWEPPGCDSYRPEIAAHQPHIRLSFFCCWSKSWGSVFSFINW